MTTPDDTFEVTRRIPVPSTVSAHARQFLAMGFSFGGGAMPQPDRPDLDGWRAVIAAGDLEPRRVDRALRRRARPDGPVPLTHLR